MEKKYNSYYFINNGSKNQVYEFLSKMNRRILEKTIFQMKQLEIYGINTEMCNIKKFQNGIWKIRTKDPSNNVRLFFYIIDNNIYYLYGFYKKTQKTPEGKKITINNLKIKLLDVLKNNNVNKYIKSIDYVF